MAMNFVLVHGAWHGAWAWTGVIEELAKLGHPAFAPTIRGHGPNETKAGVTQQDFVDSVVQFVEVRDLHDVILVAHSWGGYVAAPAVAPLGERMRGVAFLNAFVPLDRQSMFDANPPEFAAEYRALSAARPDGSIPMTWDHFRTNLMQTASEEAARVVHHLLTPVPLATFSGLPEMSGFHEAPIRRLWVGARDDIAMPRTSWDVFADRLGDHDTAEIDGDHEGLFLHPGAVARVLADAATRWTDVKRGDS